jgi:hypothetical protein
MRRQKNPDKREDWKAALDRVQSIYDRIALHAPESDRKNKVLRRLAEREDRFLERLHRAESWQAF